MAITFWRNVQRKITTQEMDASFDTLVNDIANAGLSAEMPEGQIYIGDNTNNASLETLDTSIVPETTDKRYQSDLQDTYNDATSSIQTQLNNKLNLSGNNANQDIDIDGFGVNAKHFKVNGTAGAGHIGLKHQSANITASASESSIGADSVGDPVWKNDGGAIDKLELQSNKTGTVTGNEASTSKYLTVKGVYDWAVALFAPKASPTFTGTVTTPDIIVSGATASTIAHFDGTKNIESLPLATYPSLTELSYVKGVTSAIQTQLDNATEIAYETWSTNANYTTINTTAKRLIILQTGTLTATRTLTLSTPSTPGQEVVIVASGSISSTIKIIVAVGFKINATLNSIDIILPYSQTWITSNGGGGWSTSQATPQFTETATALTSSKILRSDKQIGIGIATSYTAPWSTGVMEGDIVYKRSGEILARNDAGVTLPFIAYNPRNGWENYRPNGGAIKYWNGQTISSGNKPIIYSTSLGYVEYYYSSYLLELRPESSGIGLYRCIFYVNGTGVPSIIKVLKDSSTITASVSGGTINVTGVNCYANINQLGWSYHTELPELYESYSNDGQIKFLTQLGVGHTSQVSSAIVQADSTSKGFLPPRMTNVQRTNIVSPAIGLMVYCTDTIEGLYIYKSTGWTFII